MQRYWVVARFAAHVELVRSGSAFGSDSPHHALMGRSGLLECPAEPLGEEPCPREPSLCSSLQRVEATAGFGYGPPASAAPAMVLVDQI